MSQLNPPMTRPSTPNPPAERDKRRAKSVRWLITPSTGVLFLWMAIPLAMTIWYSFSRYNLLNPDVKGFAGFDNYEFLATDPVVRPVDRSHADADRLGARDHGGRRRAAGGAVRPQVLSARASRGCW